MNPMLAALRPDRQHPFQELVIDADNARVHTGKMVYEYFHSHHLRLTDHPPDSQHLSRSDFFLFFSVWIH
jgi:hypothetical protein